MVHAEKQNIGKLIVLHAVNKMEETGSRRMVHCVALQEGASNHGQSSIPISVTFWESGDIVKNLTGPGESEYWKANSCSTAKQGRGVKSSLAIAE